MDNSTLPTAETDQLTSADELKELISGSNGLTMLPAVAMQALDIANDPDFSMKEFVEVIERDPHLVTDILSLSNSSAYATQKEIRGIQHAVNLIGCGQCKNLIISSSVKALAKKLPPSVEWARNVLWSHSILTATIARSINTELKLGFEGEEFSSAMVHDLGRLLIAAAAPHVFEVVDRLTFNETAGVLENERMLMGTDHCEIGAWFAESGNLPLSLVEVIRYHHDPSDDLENSLLVHLVNAADQMANYLTYAGGTQDFVVETVPSLEVLFAQSSAAIPDAVIRIMQAAEQAFAECASSLSIKD